MVGLMCGVMRGDGGDVGAVGQGVVWWGEG